MEEDNSLVQEEVKASALRLINQHLDFDALMNEMSNVDFQLSLVSEIEGGVFNSVNEQTIHESLKLQASLSAMSIEDAATQMILKKLCRIAEKHVISSEIGDLSAAFTAFKEIGLRLSIQDMMQYQDNFQHCLPLNVLLQMEDAAVLSLKDYLMVNVNNKTILKEFLWSLIHVARQDKNVPDSLRIAAGILACLVRYAYGIDQSPNKALKKMCGYILFNVTKNHLQHFLSLHPSQSVLRDSLRVIPLIRENLQQKTDELRKCFVQMITLWITDSPKFKVSDAISSQHLWIASKQNEALSVFYKEMTVCTGLQLTLSTIGNILERREVNWKHLLTFASALLVSFPESPKALKGLIWEKMKIGIESFSVELLTVSILLARQLSLEGSHAFTSYTSWFHECFGPQSSLISSNRASRFLIKFLTDIVPYEPVRYLKAHIVKPPHVPSSCMESFNLYASLARIRIAELGSSLSETPDDTGNSAEIEKDVQKVLEEYKKMSKIPKSVMEASIFQKVYFCKKFLPALLKPRPLPACPDITMKLIEDMLRAQKIPKNMYGSYLEKCKKENAKLLQEVMILDDDSEFEDDKDPHEQFQNVLQLVADEIHQILSSKGDSLGSGKLSSELLTKMTRTLNSATNGDSDDTVNVDDDYVADLCCKPVKNKVLTQITDALFAWLGQIQDNYSTAVRTGGEKLKDLLKAVLDVIIWHRALNLEICAEIWKCCTSEISLNSDTKLRGMSLYLSVEGSHVKVKIHLPKCGQGRILSSLRFTKSVEHWQLVATASLTDAVRHCLQFYENEESQLSAFKFACYIMRNSLLLTDESPGAFKDLFQCLGKRITHCDHASGAKRLLKAYGSPPSKCAKLEERDDVKCFRLYQELCAEVDISKQTVSRAVFIMEEMKINTNKDMLTSKQRYLLYSEIFFGSPSTELELLQLWEALIGEFSCNQQEELTTSNLKSPVVSFLWKSMPVLLESCNELQSNSRFIYNLIKKGTEDDCRHKDGFFREIQWQNRVEALLVILLSMNPSFLFHCRAPESNEYDNIWGCEIIHNDNTGLKLENLEFVGKLVNDFLQHVGRDGSDFFTLGSVLTDYLITGIFESPSFSTKEFLHFSIVTCPCLFSSLLARWTTHPGLSFVVKIRNAELYSFVEKISRLLKGENILPAYEELYANMEVKGNEQSEKRRFVNFCLASAFLDMPRPENFCNTNNLRMKLSGLEKDMLGHIASCAILKISEIPSESDKNPVTILLQNCVSMLRPRYLREEVLMGSLIDVHSVLFPSAANPQQFHVAALKSLALIEVSQSIIMSEHYLPALLSLKQSVSRTINEGRAAVMLEIASGLPRVESLALRNAPDATIVDCFKKFPSADLRNEIARRRLPVRY